MYSELSFAEVSIIMAHLVTRRNEFSLFEFGFVKGINFMTFEVSHEGRRKKNYKYFFGP